MVPSSSVVVEQFLHGYDGGHKLLTASRRLTPNSERAMLVLSDLSGPTRSSGFDTYITGYPLQSEGLFVVARTWYAGEMSRPGCVWTHSLAVKPSDVGNNADLRRMLGAFRRPVDGATDNGYAEPLPIGGVSLDIPASSESPEERLITPEMVAALFAKDAGSIILPAQSSDQYEWLLLQTWVLLWPALRQNFGFCSGSLSNRKYEQRDFDLQVVPERIAPLVQRKTRDGVIIRKGAASPYSGWVAVVAHALRSETETDVKRVLKEYSTDIPNQRTSVMRLAVSIEPLLNVDDGVTTTASDNFTRSMVGLVAAGFPSKDEARTLKRAFLGHPAERDSLARRLGESELLTGYVDASRREAGAFDAVELRIADRAESLWRHERLDGRLLVVKAVLPTRPTRLQAAFALGVARVISAREAIELNSISPGIVRKLARHNATIAQSVETWELTVEHTPLRGVQWKTLAERERSCILRVMSQATNSRLPAFAMRHYPGQLIIDLLDALNEATASHLSDTWLAALNDHQIAVAGWLEAKQADGVVPALLLQVIGTIDPRIQTLKGPLIDWTSQAAKALLVAGPDARRCLPPAVTLLALGLGDSGTEPWRLVSASYQLVHDAIAEGKLTPQLWQRLASVVPSQRSWSWRRDDRPERLHIALADAFLDHSWPLSVFAECIKTEATLDEFFETDASQIRRLRRKLKDHARHDQLSDRELTSLQRYLH